MGHVTWQPPFQERRLWLTMINLSTKFEVSMFKSTWRWKGNTKCRNSDGFGWLGVTQGHQQHNHSIQYIFPIKKPCVYLVDKFHRAVKRLCVCVYLVPFSSYSKLFVESHNFNPLHLHLVDPILMSPRFLADRTIGRAFGTVSRLSVVCPSSVRL